MVSTPPAVTTVSPMLLVLDFLLFSAATAAVVATTPPVLKIPLEVLLSNLLVAVGGEGFGELK